MFDYGNEPSTLSFFDLDGKPVERTPFSHPYNFDDYVIWQSADYKKGDAAVYSDRLRMWDEETWEKLHNEKRDLNIDNPTRAEEYLSLYYNKEIKLTAIMRGCNQANGFPYYIFFYREV